MGKKSFFGIIILSVLGFLIASTVADLKLGFYDKSCPNAENIVLAYVKNYIPNVPTLAAPLLRMAFHDCFVRGCDASVLLNDTSNNQAEKDARPNLSLRGFDFIDEVKSLLEAECPGIVSCADIISLVARDSVVVTGGPYWKVPTGRRDGTISRASEALSNLPGANENFNALQEKFAIKGLNIKDLVLLSGAHTIGIAHCNTFSNRIYNFTGVGDEDPGMDSAYALSLRANKCKTPTDTTTIVEMDPGSAKNFDLSYYKLLVKRRGLFQSDAALTTDYSSLSYINQLLKKSPLYFFEEFAKSMEKMGAVGVKIGTDGQIRKHCALVNK
ncbi:Peroxidase [Thalictrum thalictroides]|uniref:Peroxidase n=1 Tax=Thalictrum thalictroides TaxID=46969 RepID=A0A7J6V102_THATH|nr:Peroxidase [Thalictrum thalictroides]